MSLTNANYFTKARQGNLVENWLVNLFFDAEGATNYIGLSNQNVNINNKFYNGAIANTSDIREEINLAKSTAKTGNVTITVANYIRRGSYLSEELFGGTRNYYNRKVEIRSQINHETTYADCLLIYTGRLVNITQTNDTLTLEIEEKRPWNFLSAPNTFTEDKNIYFPVVYGEFTPNDSDYSGQDLCNNRDLWPAPVGNATAADLFGLVHEDGVSASGRLHYWLKDSDQFIPMLANAPNTDGYNDASEVFQGGDAIRADANMYMSFKFKPNAEASDNEADDIANAYDFRVDDSTTYSRTTVEAISPAGAVAVDKDFKALLPNIPFRFTELKFFIRFRVQITDNDPSNAAGNIFFKSYGRNDIVIAQDFAHDGGDSGIVTWTSGDLISDYNSNNYQLPSSVYLLLETETSNDETDTGTFDIYDIQVYGKVNKSFSADPEGAKSFLDSLENLYCGGAGLTQGITGGASAAITEIHEAHLDILNRFAGLDVDTDPDTDIDGWTALDAAKDWEVNYWILEPTGAKGLQDILESLQLEGGFIFKFGAAQEMKYIFIPDGAPSLAATLGPEDITSPTVKNTPFKELLTKMDVKYGRHPGKKEYISAQTAVNSTARTDWNIQTDENILEVKLDAYSSPAIPATPGTNPNDDFYSYYDNINGTLKLILEFELLNWTYSFLETGDFIKLDTSMKLKAFNYAYSAKTFMITKTSRGRGKIKITAREVYST